MIQTKYNNKLAELFYKIFPLLQFFVIYYLLMKRNKTLILFIINFTYKIKFIYFFGGTSVIHHYVANFPIKVKSKRKEKIILYNKYE